jgi:hypothetical protein
MLLVFLEIESGASSLLVHPLPAATASAGAAATPAVETTLFHMSDDAGVPGRRGVVGKA